MDAAPDLSEEHFPLILNRAEIGTDLLDRRTLDGRCPDDLGRPADLFCDLPEGCPVLPDDNTRFLSLDQHLAGLRVKEDLGDPCVLRHNRPDLLRRPLRVFKDIRAHDYTFPEIPCQYLYQVRLVGELFRIIGIYDELGTLELDVRDRNPARNNPVNLLLELLEFIFNNH